MANALNITLAESTSDGARAAAELVADGRLREERARAPGLGGNASADRWEDPGFNLDDAALAAFNGLGCETFSRYAERHGWDLSHWRAFQFGFTQVAHLCLAGHLPSFPSQHAIAHHHHSLVSSLAERLSELSQEAGGEDSQAAASYELAAEHADQAVTHLHHTSEVLWALGKSTGGTHG